MSGWVFHLMLGCCVAFCPTIAQLFSPAIPKIGKMSVKYLQAVLAWLTDELKNMSGVGKLTKKIN